MAIIQGDDGPNRLVGTSGDDQIYGQGGDDILIGGSGGDLLDGGPGNGDAGFEDDPTRVLVDLATGRADGGFGFPDQLVNVGNLIGSPFSDVLSGGGNDRLDGGADGGIASFVDAPSSVLVDLAANSGRDGFGGQDRLTSLGSIFGSAHNDLLTGSNRDIGITGLAGNGLITAEDGDDFIEPGPGNDLVDGGAGRDQLSYFSEPGVTVDLSRGIANDGSGGTDRIGGIEDLHGSLLDDVIIGDGNPNRILADNGADTVTGGGGADIFVFTETFEFGDTIRDFESGADMLEFHRNEVFRLEQRPPFGKLGAEHFAIATPKDADDFFIWNPLTRDLTFDFDGNGPGTAQLIAHFDTGAIAPPDILMA